MHIEGHHRFWDVHDQLALEEALRSRDGRGGAELWLAADRTSYPVMAIRISGEFANVTYFPFEEHPGFRALAETGTPCTETMIFIYEGCDPESGVEEPSEFILPVSEALALAREFHRTGDRPTGARWFEL